MARCEAKTKEGKRCKKTASPRGKKCSIHKAKRSSKKSSSKRSSAKKSSSKRSKKAEERGFLWGSLKKLWNGYRGAYSKYLQASQRGKAKAKKNLDQAKEAVTEVAQKLGFRKKPDFAKANRGVRESLKKSRRRK